MTEPLKHFFDPALIRSIATDLGAAHPSLRRRAFVAECVDGLDTLELAGRAGHVADVMRRHLPARFADAADVIIRALGPDRDGTETSGMAPFRYWPHTIYVARHGAADPADFESAMRAQYELTKRFTAEFSIRAYLEARPEATLARLAIWAGDPSVHVRRLVSEGTRPRLPWAPRLRAFQRDPTPVIALLERLADDPERYVQRSVANNLGDIAKDHPDRVVALCRRWPKRRRWIVNHALRSLIKAGHPGALDVVGCGETPAVAIEAPAVPTRARIGDTLAFRFTLASTARAAQDLLVDYAVHFVKADGAARPKVFKLRRLALAAGARHELAGRISLAVLSTRTPHPGRHVVDVRVNGHVFPLGAIEVRA